MALVFAAALLASGAGTASKAVTPDDDLRCAAWAAMWAGRLEKKDKDAAASLAMGLSYFTGRWEGASSKDFEQGVTVDYYRTHTAELERASDSCLARIEGLGFRMLDLGTALKVAGSAQVGQTDQVLPKKIFADESADLQLDFPPDKMDRRTLPNGKEFFSLSGKITNIGKQIRLVPTIKVVLRDGQDQIVYSWEITASKRQLNAGESVTLNEAILDIPRTAKIAEIGWKPD